MAHRIRWTPVAVEDLTAIRDYIRRENRQAADRVVRAIRDSVRSLADYPFSGHVVPEFEPRQLREVPAYRHRIIYRVRDNTVEVLAVVHGARDLSALWEREGRPTPEGDAPGTN